MGERRANILQEKKVTSSSLLQTPKLKTQTPNPKPPNPKPKTQNPKPKTQIPNPKPQNPNPQGNAGGPGWSAPPGGPAKPGQEAAVTPVERAKRRAKALRAAERAGMQVLHINVQRFRGGLVFKAHRLCVSLNSRLGSNKEEEEQKGYTGISGPIRATLLLPCPHEPPYIHTILHTAGPMGHSRNAFEVHVGHTAGWPTPGGCTPSKST